MQVNRHGKTVKFDVNQDNIQRLLDAKKKLGAAFPRVGILIISYNASTLLKQTVERIPAELIDVVEEIFIFDDASKDDTFEVAKDLLKTSHWREKLNVFRNPMNRGYGGNQKVGFRYAIDRGLDYVVMLHGDGQYAPEHMPDLLVPAIEDRAMVVFGSRMVNRMDALAGGMPLYKWLGNQVLTKFENMILGIELAEYHTGYRLYATEVLKRIPFEENTDVFHFDSQIIVQVRALGTDITEVPIRTFYGNEVCHVNGFQYAKDVCISVLEYRLHQLHLIRRSRYLVKQDIVYTRKQSPYSSHERILSLMSTPGRALDLGSSSGQLTEAMLTRNIRATGVDIVPAEKVSAKFEAYIQCDLEQPQSLNFKREFDYVVLADIVEHLRNPEVLLQKAKTFLKPEGRMIVSVPNIAIWVYRLSLAMGRFNYGPKGILDETHVKLYTLDTIRQLIERSGYVITKSDFTGIPFEVAFQSVGKSKILKFIDWLYFQCVRFWPRMFAYQIIMEAKISSLDAIKKEGQVTT
jgi:glycosyltransferase involved in cell wall biosynthesis/ubiquinone/menaquinone biosynthesis C-methylase UbiE